MSTRPPHHRNRTQCHSHCPSGTLLPQRPRYSVGNTGHAECGCTVQSLGHRAWCRPGCCCLSPHWLARATLIEMRSAPACQVTTLSHVACLRRLHLHLIRLLNPSTARNKPPYLSLLSKHFVWLSFVIAAAQSAAVTHHSSSHSVYAVACLTFST